MARADAVEPDRCADKPLEEGSLGNAVAGEDGKQDAPCIIFSIVVAKIGWITDGSGGG